MVRRISRWSGRFARLVCVPLLLGACAAGSGGAWSGGDVAVRFDHRSIEPASARLGKGQHVRWFSGSGDFGGRVVFPQSIASKSSCHGLGPGFRLIDGRYVSELIQVDGERQLKLLCTLAPGRYPYEIQIYGLGLESESEPAVVENRLHGELVVE